jgi:beta-galactosidase
MWATHVWNMFDFGADGRNEGGENGQNYKGLMTFDRKYKKDSFYAYKAWLVDAKDDPFVHICGKRYVDRVEDVTKVTVYSNLPSVELFANGESLGVKESAEHFFYFDVPNKGKTTLTAKAGSCTDESTINKVEKFNEKYRLKEEGALLNWFDITAPEGYFSLNDKLSDIMTNPTGKAFFMQMMGSMKGGMMGGDKSPAEMMAQADGMMAMLGSFTVLRLTSLFGAGGVKYTKEQLLGLNAELNKIQK